MYKLGRGQADQLKLGQLKLQKNRMTHFNNCLLLLLIISQMSIFIREHARHRPKDFGVYP